MTKQKVRIICTLGPASSEETVLENMVSAGMDVARLNFSHGSHQSHQTLIERVRKVGQVCDKEIPVLQDLEGFRIRVGRFKGPRKSIELVKGQQVSMIKAEVSDRENIIPFDYAGSLQDIYPGCMVFIDDGNIALKVKNVTEGFIVAVVEVGGRVKEHKGINIPGACLKFLSLTDKDKKNIKFGIINNVDYIAQSFVRSADDMINVKEFVNENGYDCPLIAKIESREGIENIDEILEVCDGVMIARGDMGVSLPIYEVPMIQKRIIAKCNQKSKMVITATQMLESMTEHYRPTRAEVSDVANAILDGTDFVMLSGETAAGAYPVETVKMMQDIIDFIPLNGN